MLLRYQACLLFFILIICQPLSLRAADDESLMQLMEEEYLNLSFGTGVEFETGDYGTDTTIDTWQVPLIIEWAPHNRLSLALEIPYIHQDQNGDTVLIGGTPTPTGNQNGPGDGTGDGSGGGNGSGDGSGQPGTFSSSEEGLGDITLDVALTLLDEQERTPRLLGLLYAKLPTADDDKGLGTGEFDWGGGLGVRKRFDNWSTYAEAIYIVPGTSETYDPDGYWDWLVSVSYRTNYSFQPGLSLSGGTAPFDGGDDPLEIKARVSGITGDITSYSLYVSHGLSDASPDWGVGIFGYLDF